MLTEDQEIRFRCLEFVSAHDHYLSPIRQMIEAIMFYRFIKGGMIPVKASDNAEIFADELFEKSLQELIKLRPELVQYNQAADRGNDETKGFQLSQSFISQFLKKFGLKKPAIKQ